MDGRSEMRALSSCDIIGVVVEKHLRFKTAGMILEEREPDDDAARALIDAYRDGRAPPWMTAYLLGCLRASSGYETARQILESAPGSLAESYAGPAMAHIRGDGAESDLREIMMNGAALKVREGAAYGIGFLGQPRLVPLVQHALVRERIRRGTAAHVMWKLGIASGSVVTLLKSPNDRERGLGVDLAMYLLQKPQPANVINVIRDAMSSVPLAPRTRRQLEERLATSSAP